ncbi:MAG: hypothetical protein EOP82_23970 [Variovorax sp.]|nr:MAG: hypothetical protein EOP82_23970 [Variovorax sp.]
MDMAVTAQADPSSLSIGTTIQTRVLILGGQGALGRVVAEAFRQQGWDVLRAGRRQESAADFRQFDIDDEALLGVGLAGADLIVNTVESRRLAPERYILEHGGLLLNLATVPQSERERLQGAVASPRGTVIFNVGFSGLMAKVAADLVATRPEAELLVIGCTLTAGGTSGPEGQAFIQRLLRNRPSHTSSQLDFGLSFGRRRTQQVDEMGREGWVSRRVLGDRPLHVHITSRSDG